MLRLPLPLPSNLVPFNRGCWLNVRSTNFLTAILTTDRPTCSITDWFFFLVLDIGNPEIDSIPFGTRFLLGFLQATAVRAAGFATVTLSGLAPAVKYVHVVSLNRDWC